ncbi:MAG: lyase family protein [Paracoccus sp. (in: a-proteobacteria)]
MIAAADNALYARLFGDPDTAAFFTAEAELAAMIQVEAALAQAQSALGLIPADAGPAIARACAGLQIDPAALAAATARNGVPVPALVAALREAMPGLPQAAYLHWGATSQDIMDTALALRLRGVLALWQGRLDAILRQLAVAARDHADLPMAARTYGQVATPTSFGAVVASWGWPLLDHAQDLAQLDERVLRVSLSGAAGTLSAMGGQGPAVRAELARALDLADPGHGWHSDRAGLGRCAQWTAGLAASLGKMAEDLLLLTQSGIGLVRIEGGGASSTMPQKQNPVGPSAMAALSRQVIGLASVFGGAGMHRQQRDGAAWFTEWLTLPQICVSTGALLRLAGDVLARMQPDAPAMAQDLAAGQGTIHAEALTFAVTRLTGLTRAEASTRVADLCAEARRSGCDLLVLAARDWPGHDWPGEVAACSLGAAPDEARGFCARVTPEGAA